MDVEKLRELERRATPGPWMWTDSYGREPIGDYQAVNLLRPDGTGVLGCDPRKPRINDAALIVALRNAAPEILEKLARIEKLERVAEAARMRSSGLLRGEAEWADMELRAALADLDGGKG